MSRLPDPPHAAEPGGIVGLFGDSELLRRARQGLLAMAHRAVGAPSLVLTDGDRLLRGEGGDPRSPRAVVGQLASAGRAPICGEARGEPLALAFEGSLIEAEAIRAEVQDQGAVLQTTREPELVLHRLAQSVQGTLINRLVDALRGLRGGWALLVLSPERLVAVRDPWGLRTLWTGRVGTTIAFATESGALRSMGGRALRELHPGEMVIVDATGTSAITPFPRGAFHPCTLDAIARDRDDSDANGQPLYRLRLALGERLATVLPVEADAVVPLPPDGLVPAQGFARVAALPMLHALIPTPGERPLTAIRAACDGQRLILLVRTLSTGRQARAAVRALRDAGAARVHLRILSPPMAGPCRYGVDLPDPETLLLSSSDSNNAASSLGVDSLAWLSIEALREAMGAPAACTACFTGTWPLLPELRQGLRQLPLFSGESDAAL